ncbi:DUF2062 domain-containing protein [Alkalilimnicola ehrlichii MLHE-1]|uniref:DUF2062 domain-containing protein n=1 Tax=Alkalilimnicola ehrlichii (strain ATCC BAA-1101 / DSM 17681 / MLHE-1) TaxID=187272 RepID=Q0A8Q0_ALKEH|nr:DUF2062 domain-containing protein [Alkalilimnicola ehrlichii]ABI56787.1 conserved hypothetical protein [Alkalilimnicola ehrlichii MLHE-1]
MPRRMLKRWLPDRRVLHENRWLRLFGRLTEDPFLLHLNRRSISGGLGIGVFVAFLPIPLQMLVAGGMAIVARVNILLAVATVWISNPFTMPPMLYFCYRVGTALLGGREQRAPFELRLEWFWDNMAAIWQPLVLGSVVVGVVAGLASYGLVHLLWRIYIYRHLRDRRIRRERALQTRNPRPDPGPGTKPEPRRNGG